MGKKSLKVKKREIFNANIMIGSATHVLQQQSQSQTRSDSSTVNESSPSLPQLRPSFLPTAPDQVRTERITAIGNSYVDELVYGDCDGHLFKYQQQYNAVTQFLILKDEVRDATSTTPTTTPISHSIAELAFRRDMDEKHLIPYRSSEPILDFCTYEPQYGEKIKDEYMRINRMDVIHPHTITRIEWIASNWGKDFHVPRIIGLRTIFTLPPTTTIVSTLPFPGIPVGYDIEIGPYVFTQVGSGHIYLMQPNSTEPPTVLVRDAQLKALVPLTTVDGKSDSVLDSADNDSGIAPIMCPSATTIPSPKDAKFSWTTNSMFVMSHGCVFRVILDPINFTLMEIKLLIGTSPHLTHSQSTSTTQPHTSKLFFRVNSSDYRLQEMNDPTRLLNDGLFVLDRMEGCIAEFSPRTFGLVQCIEPSIESAGITVQKPFQHFCVLPRWEHIWLLDSSGLVVYDWTSEYADQLKYEFGGRQLAHIPPTLNQPLRGGIVELNVVMKPPIAQLKYTD